MTLRSFLPKSILVLALSALLSYAVLIALERSGYLQTAAIGMGIGYVNALIGFLSISHGKERSTRTFLVLFLGGMIFRFLLIFAALFVLIRVFNLDQVAILVPLIATYFLFLGLEVLMVQAAESERTNEDDDGFVAGR